MRNEQFQLVAWAANLRKIVIRWRHSREKVCGSQKANMDPASFSKMVLSESGLSRHENGHVVLEDASAAAKVNLQKRRSSHPEVGQRGS